MREQAVVCLDVVASREGTTLTIGVVNAAG